MKNVTQRWIQSGPFFINQDTFFLKSEQFFQISKKEGGPLSSLVVCLWVAEYSTVFLNIFENDEINCSMSGQSLI